MILGIDFDGTLVEHNVRPLRWRRGAREFLVAAITATQQGAGNKIWLHSCRCSPMCVLLDPAPADAEEFWRSGRVNPDVEYSWSLFNEMRAFLIAEGVWWGVELWQRPGKPICDHYIDDLSDRPDWLVLAAELGVRLMHAEQRGTSPLGAPIPVGSNAVVVPIAGAGITAGFAAATVPTAGNDVGG